MHACMYSPMDFLIAPRHRWIYVGIFGVMGVVVFNTWHLSYNIDVGDNLYLRLFIKLSKLWNGYDH